jgi:hypothetical protein
VRGEFGTEAGLAHAEEAKEEERASVRGEFGWVRALSSRQKCAPERERWVWGEETLKRFIQRWTRCSRVVGALCCVAKIEATREGKRARVMTQVQAP